MCNVQVSRVLAGVGHTAHPGPTMVQALVAKCITQTEKLTALLHSSAQRELETLMTQMAPSSYRLKQEPQTIRALAQALDTHKARGGAAALEERFQPLYDVYDLLERREVGPLSSGTACWSGAAHGAFGRCMTCTAGWSAGRWVSWGKVVAGAPSILLCLLHVVLAAAAAVRCVWPAGAQGGGPCEHVQGGRGCLLVHSGLRCACSAGCRVLRGLRSCWRLCDPTAG